MNAMAEPYCVANPLLPNSPEISAAKRQPSLSTVSDLCNAFFTSLVIEYCLLNYMMLV